MQKFILYVFLVFLPLGFTTSNASVSSASLCKPLFYPVTAKESPKFLHEEHTALNRNQMEMQSSSLIRKMYNSFRNLFRDRRQIEVDRLFGRHYEKLKEAEIMDFTGIDLSPQLMRRIVKENQNQVLEVRLGNNPKIKTQDIRTMLQENRGRIRELHLENQWNNKKILEELSQHHKDHIWELSLVNARNRDLDLISNFTELRVLNIGETSFSTIWAFNGVFRAKPYVSEKRLIRFIREMKEQNSSFREIILPNEILGNIRKLTETLDALGLRRSFLSIFSNPEVIKVKDGDTFTFRINELPASRGDEIVIRLKDINTAEMSANKNSHERKVAEAARNYAKNLLDNHPTRLYGLENGSYREVSKVQVKIDGKWQNLAQLIMINGLAVRGYINGKFSKEEYPNGVNWRRIYQTNKDHVDYWRNYYE